MLLRLALKHSTYLGPSIFKYKLRPWDHLIIDTFLLYITEQYAPYKNGLNNLIYIT